MVNVVPGDQTLSVLWGLPSGAYLAAVKWRLQGTTDWQGPVFGVSTVKLTGLTNATAYDLQIVFLPTGGVKTLTATPVDPTPVPPPPTNPPDWYGAFGAPGSSIPSSLYPFQSFVSGHVTVADDPKGSSVSVAKFAINNADQPYSGSPPRGDVYSSFVFTPNMDKWISIPLYTPPAGLPATINSGSGNWLLTQQLAIPGGNAQPQLTWSVTSDPLIGHTADDHLHWSMYLRSPQAGQIWLGPVVDDAWHTLIVHVVTETTNGGTNGSVELWYDGVKQSLYNGSQILSGIRVLEKANDGINYKAQLGIDSYRAPNLIAGTYTLYHGAPKIGPTYASVS